MKKLKTYWVGVEWGNNDLLSHRRNAEPVRFRPIQKGSASLILAHSDKRKARYCNKAFWEGSKLPLQISVWVAHWLLVGIRPGFTRRRFRTTAGGKGFDSIICNKKRML